jgi:NADH dehydrogenase
VGTALAGKLAGHELILPSRDPGRAAAAGLRGVFPPFRAELASLVEEYRPEVVVNLLGIIREAGDETFEKVHLEYSRRLAAGAAAAGVARFVQMSAQGADPASRSRYQATKGLAEQAVRAAGLPCVIFRPSFITGPGQKLFAELAGLAAFVPLLAAPAAEAAPVNISDVADCLARAAVEGLPDGVYELGGDETMTLAELFRRGLAARGVRRPVLSLPRRLFLPLLPVFSLFKTPPMTPDQYRMLAAPNVPSGRYPGVREILGEARPAF